MKRKLAGNTFLYFGDKNVSKVSGIWKVLHISVYVAIAMSSFIASIAAGNTFQTFKYNCVLFCTDIKFEPSTTRSDATTGTIIGNSTNNSSSNDTDMEIYKIDVRKTIFSSNLWCDCVLAIALISFIFATFCVVILAMCSRGGKGKNNTLNRPQNMVYPILISSVILGILNASVAILVKRGMQKFCANFEVFSGEKTCSPLVNKFTLHEKQSNFYLPYLVLSHIFNLIVVLFVCQAVVTLLRVIYAVDYQLYTLEMEDESSEEGGVLEVQDGHVIKDRRV